MPITFMTQKRKVVQHDKHYKQTETEIPHR